MAGYYPDGKGKPGRKPKFRPRITRIKLNPEQAVLNCSCYNVGFCTTGWARRTFVGDFLGVACSGKTHKPVYDNRNPYQWLDNVYFMGWSSSVSS